MATRTRTEQSSGRLALETTTLGCPRWRVYEFDSRRQSTSTGASCAVCATSPSGCSAQVASTSRSRRRRASPGTSYHGEGRLKTSGRPNTKGSEEGGPPALLEQSSSAPRPLPRLPRAAGHKTPASRESRNLRHRALPRSTRRRREEVWASARAASRPSAGRAERVLARGGSPDQTAPKSARRDRLARYGDLRGAIRKASSLRSANRRPPRHPLAQHKTTAITSRHRACRSQRYTNAAPDLQLRAALVRLADAEENDWKTSSRFRSAEKHLIKGSTLLPDPPLNSNSDAQTPLHLLTIVRDARRARRANRRRTCASSRRGSEMVTTARLERGATHARALQYLEQTGHGVDVGGGLRQRRRGRRRRCDASTFVVVGTRSISARGAVALLRGRAGRAVRLH